MSNIDTKIQLASSFTATIAGPLDAKFTAATIAEMNSYVTRGLVEQGMICFNKETDKYYKFTGVQPSGTDFSACYVDLSTVLTGGGNVDDIAYKTKSNTFTAANTFTEAPTVTAVQATSLSNSAVATTKFVQDVVAIKAANVDTDKALTDVYYVKENLADPTTATDKQIIGKKDVLGIVNATAVLPNATQTLTNKTLTNPIINNSITTNGQLVIKATQGVSFNNTKVTGVADPTTDTDAVNKKYVDLLHQGLSPKQYARVATTANITLSGLLTVDGVALAEGDSVIVWKQTNAAENGIYVVHSGSWTRRDDASTWDDLVSAYIFASEGTTYHDVGFNCTINKGGTLGNTEITFVQFTGAGSLDAGNGIAVAGNTVSVKVVTNSGLTSTAAGVGTTGNLNQLATYSTNGLMVYNGNKVNATTITNSAAATTEGTKLALSGTTLTLSTDTRVKALAGVNFTAQGIPVFTNNTTAVFKPLSNFGSTLIDDADASTARTTLGLGTIATQNATSVAITGGTIKNVTMSNTIIDGGTF